MKIDTYTRVYYPAEEGDVKLIWSENTFSRRNPNGSNESIVVAVTLDDFSLAVSDIPEIGIKNSIEFMRETLRQFDEEQAAQG